VRNERHKLDVLSTSLIVVEECCRGNGIATGRVFGDVINTLTVDVDGSPVSQRFEVLFAGLAGHRCHSFACLNPCFRDSSTCRGVLRAPSLHGPSPFEGVAPIQSLLVSRMSLDRNEAVEAFSTLILGLARHPRPALRQWLCPRTPSPGAGIGGCRASRKA